MTDKRVTLDRILAAWERAPRLRLGELLQRAAWEHGESITFVRDERLTGLVDLFVDRLEEETKP
jgi:hypothetical protein